MGPELRPAHSRQFHDRLIVVRNDDESYGSGIGRPNSAGHLVAISLCHRPYCLGFGGHGLPPAQIGIRNLSGPAWGAIADASARFLVDGQPALADLAERPREELRPPSGNACIAIGL
jgi:hypothetical protein